jgi:hypothetical protein
LLQCAGAEALGIAGASGALALGIALPMSGVDGTDGIPPPHAPSTTPNAAMAARSERITTFFMFVSPPTTCRSALH